MILGLSAHPMLLHANVDMFVIGLFYMAYPNVAGISYSSAEAQALPCEGGTGCSATCKCIGWCA